METCLCTLDDEIKKKLTTIFEKYESTRDPEAEKEYKELGVSTNDWFRFCCDKLEIVDIE
jgi:hypothetical protein